MTKKAKSEQSSSPDISFSEHFDVLNEKIDSNTKSIVVNKKSGNLVHQAPQALRALIAGPRTLI